MDTSKSVNILILNIYYLNIFFCSQKRMQLFSSSILVTQRYGKNLLIWYFIINWIGLSVVGLAIAEIIFGFVNSSGEIFGDTCWICIHFDIIRKTTCILFLATLGLSQPSTTIWGAAGNAGRVLPNDQLTPSLFYLLCIQYYKYIIN
jgi:hypothetical protein